jgi:hypothetical protein
MNKSESIGKISAALVKAQSEMGNASKDSKNPFFKSSYADLNAIREVTIPVLNTHGITILQPTTVVEGKPYVETTLLHESGEYLTSLTEIISPKQNDPQAHGSGVSYARRYGLQAFLCVGAEDDDGEKAMGRSTGGRSMASKSNTTVETKKEETPSVKKGGFGVKKTVDVSTEESGATEDGWS